MTLEEYCQGSSVQEEARGQVGRWWGYTFSQAGEHWVDNRPDMGTWPRRGAACLPVSEEHKENSFEQQLTLVSHSPQAIPSAAELWYPL